MILRKITKYLTKIAKYEDNKLVALRFSLNTKDEIYVTHYRPFTNKSSVVIFVEQKKCANFDEFKLKANVIRVI